MIARGTSATVITAKALIGWETTISPKRNQAACSFSGAIATQVLNKRGINNAYLISSVFNKKIACPDVFISSCANRALHTAMIFSYTFNYFWCLVSVACHVSLVAYLVFSSYLIIYPFYLNW